MATKAKGNLKIKLVKGVVSTNASHREAVKRLGFSRIGQTVVKPDTPDVRGVIHKVAYLVQVEEE
jgi:large subunit ribosomal protein L30